MPSAAAGRPFGPQPRSVSIESISGATALGRFADHGGGPAAIDRRVDRSRPHRCRVRVLVASIGRSVVSSGGPAPILEPTVAPGPGTGVLVKFFYGSGMRLRDGRFVSMTGDDVTPLRTVLATYPGTRIERLFQRSEAELEDDDAAAQASGDYSRPDLNLYYRLVLTPGTSPYAVVADLVRLPIVERDLPGQVRRLLTGLRRMAGSAQLGRVELAGSARTGSAQTGSGRAGSARTGAGRTGSARTGSARTGAGRTGPAARPRGWSISRRPASSAVRSSRRRRWYCADGLSRRHVALTRSVASRTLCLIRSDMPTPMAIPAASQNRRPAS